MWKTFMLLLMFGYLAGAEPAPVLIDDGNAIYRCGSWWTNCVCRVMEAHDLMHLMKNHKAEDDPMVWKLIDNNLVAISASASTILDPHRYDAKDMLATCDTATSESLAEVLAFRAEKAHQNDDVREEAMIRRLLGV